MKYLSLRPPSNPLRPHLRVVEHRRPRALPTVAFVIPPALLKAAQRVAIKAIPGRLLVLEAARRGALRIPGPVTAMLVAYSIVITFQLWANKTRNEARNPNPLQNEGGNLESRNFVDPLAAAASRSDDSEAGAVVTIARQAQGKAATVEERCPVCNGTGAITWEAKFLHDGDPCPLCLGTGVTKRSLAGPLGRLFQG